MAGRAAVEEAKSLRYTLRSLGCKLSGSTTLYGDNLGMLQSSTSPDGTLKKKWESISFHLVRESVATGEGKPRKVESVVNFADALTKALPAGILYPLLEPLYEGERPVTGKRKRE